MMWIIPHTLRLDQDSQAHKKEKGSRNHIPLFSGDCPPNSQKRRYQRPRNLRSHVSVTRSMGGIRGSAAPPRVPHRLPLPIYAGSGGLRLGAPRPQDLDGVQVADFRSPRGTAWAWSSVRTAAIHESVRTMAVHDEMLRQDDLDPQSGTF